MSKTKIITLLFTICSCALYSLKYFENIRLTNNLCLPIFLKFYIIKNNFFGSYLWLLASLRESALRQICSWDRFYTLKKIKVKTTNKGLFVYLKNSIFTKCLKIILIHILKNLNLVIDHKVNKYSKQRHCLHCTNKGTKTM